LRPYLHTSLHTSRASSTGALAALFLAAGLLRSAKYLDEFGLCETEGEAVARHAYETVEQLLT
jgi:hypothetical protein